MQVLAFILARFSEPSSYAGLGALLALLGVHFSDSDLGQIAQFLAAGCALAGLLLKERGLLRMLMLSASLGTVLTACGGTGAPIIPPQVQADCAVVSWGVPIVEAMTARLNPNDQAILAQAEQAVGACAAGNAPAAVGAVAAAVTAIIYPPAS